MGGIDVGDEAKLDFRNLRDNDSRKLYLSFRVLQKHWSNFPEEMTVDAPLQFS